MHVFQGKSSFDSRFIKRAFDFEPQDLAIFHAKTIILFLKYFYIVNSVIKVRHALNIITYKAKEKGMQVIITNENYTSKCSFLDDEPIQKQSTYKGKWIKRGLFKSSNGRLINADVSGVMNILKKVIGNFNYNPIQVCSTPTMINILKP